MAALILVYLILLRSPLGRAMRAVADNPDLAAARGISPARVSLAWLLNQPGVTAPIVGATRIEQLDDALAALDVELDESERSGLEAPYQPRPDRGFL